VKAVILQHQDDAPAGLLLGALAAAGLDWRIVHLDRDEPLPTPESVGLAVSLGSDASADDAGRDWIARELGWLRAADLAGTRILGLCFGAQALALALGGGVARAERPERGWVRVSTREPNFIAPGPWLTWHDDVIELPPGAELLAHNQAGPQAFRAGRHLGVQFHPEATVEIVEDWLRGSRDGKELQSQGIFASTAAQSERAAVDARHLFTAFISASAGPVVGSPPWANERSTHQGLSAGPT
jgi:GMP synthase-like glutamine amidotransferase